MQIEQREHGRVIVIDNADYELLPALAFDATVNVWQKGLGDYLIFTQPIATPEEIPAAKGYTKIASLELEADHQAELIKARESMILTARQARLALHNIGKLADIPAAIAALSEPQKTQAEIEWEYATHIHRTNPLVPMLSTGLGLTDEQIDQMFIEGANL